MLCYLLREYTGAKYACLRMARANMIKNPARSQHSELSKK